MISKSLALQVLNACLATGGDYAEIYLEENHPVSITLENGKVETVSTPITYGAGIRILQGTQSVYGSTSDLRKKNLLSLAARLSSSFSGERQITVNT